MSFLAGGITNVVGQGAGLSKSAGLLQELTGQADRVQLIVPGTGTVLQLDVCINEQHGRDIQVTTNPLEDGSVVSDHIIVNPVNLALTGVISDTPLYDAKRFLTQSIGNAATALLPPLGVVTATTAYQLAHPQDSVFSPSNEAYRTLMRIAAGDPSASPPVPPTPITVLTRYARYPDMVIKSLAMPRDASTNGQLVFTIQLEQIQRVSPQYVSVAVLKDPALGAGKSKLGEKEPSSKIIENTKAGLSGGENLIKGAVQRIAPVTNALGNAGDAVATAIGYGG